MKMFAKILCLIMALAMMVSCFAACGDDKKEETKEDTSVSDKEDKNDKEDIDDEDEEEEEEDEEDYEDDAERIIGKWDGKVDLSGVIGSDIDLISVKAEFKKSGKYAFEIDEDEYKDALIKAIKAGLKEEDMTEDDFEEENGMSVEEYVEEGMSSTSLDVEGTYEIDGNDITFDVGEGTFEFDGDDEFTLDWDGEIYTFKRD